MDNIDTKERKGKKDIKERESIIEGEMATDVAKWNLYNQKICVGEKLSLDKNHRTATTTPTTVSGSLEKDE